MQIGFAQFVPVLGDLEANRRAVARLVAEAEGCDLLVLPELCSSGYNFPDAASLERAAEPPEGPFVRLLEELSRRHRMFLVAGFPELPDAGSGGRPYNSAALVAPGGRLGLYRKVHLFWNEKDLFAPGDLGLPVFDLDLAELGRGAHGVVRLGLLICFDWQFPEAWRVLCLKGADIVAHPSNLVLPGKAQRAVPVHAMLNRLHVILTNRAGTEGDLTFTGRSIIAGPDGEVLAEGPEQGESVQRVEIDPARARNKMVTPRNDLVADRRPEAYEGLMRGGPPDVLTVGPAPSADSAADEGHPRAGSRSS